jgi:hypothetical protein
MDAADSPTLVDVVALNGATLSERVRIFRQRARR